MPNHGKGGRRPERGVAKSAAVAIRTTPELKEKLEAAAFHYKRSVTQEIERRLEASFASDGAHPAIEMLEAIADDVKKAEELTGKSWHKDLTTWAFIREAVITEVELRCPDLERVFSDQEDIVAEQRAKLEKLGETIAHHQTTLIELGGFFAWTNGKPTVGQTLYNYEATREALAKNQLSPELKQVMGYILGQMQKADEERVEVGKLYAENIKVGLMAIAEGTALWQKERKRRGITVIPEFRIPELELGGTGEGQDVASVPAADAA